MSDKYSYSFTEDNFTGEFGTREEAIEEARYEIYGGQKHFWTGRNVPVDPLRYVTADALIEHIINHDDFCIEQAEGWPGSTKEQEEELTAALREAFGSWMARHKLTPNFWLVENVQEHVIEDEEKGKLMTFAILGELVQEVMPNLPKAKRDLYLPHLIKAIADHEINTPLRASAFLAQIAHESGELKYMEEIWGNTPQQRKYEPPHGVASKLGNSLPGDGFRFRGRGPIQITGRTNYKLYGEMLGVDLIGNPDLAAKPEYAFQTAALYWKTHGCNELADAEQFGAITKKINGGYTGLAERERYYKAAKKALGVADQ